MEQAYNVHIVSVYLENVDTSTSPKYVYESKFFRSNPKTNSPSKFI